MPVYNGKNPKELLSLISARTDASGFYATGYAPQITGLLGSGVANHHLLYDHLVRELNMASLLGKNQLTQKKELEEVS